MEVSTKRAATIYKTNCLSSLNCFFRFKIAVILFCVLLIDRMLFFFFKPIITWSNESEKHKRFEDDRTFLHQTIRKNVFNFFFKVLSATSLCVSLYSPRKLLMLSVGGKSRKMSVFSLFKLSINLCRNWNLKDLRLEVFEKLQMYVMEIKFSWKTPRMVFSCANPTNTRIFRLNSFACK